MSLPRDLLAEARELRLNVSSVAEDALRSAVRNARAVQWQEENAEALAQRARWIDANGMPLADLQVWRP